MIRIAFLCGAVLLASACGSARIVKQTQAGGELALEGDHESAMKQAHKAMRNHCQGPYTILEQGETVIGTDTVRSDQSYVDEQGNVINEGDESTRQATEWRIKYACGNVQPAPVPTPEAPGPEADPNAYPPEGAQPDQPPPPPPDY